jgi:hypothetical protein
MEMRAEDYLPMAAELKKSLNLNANQQIAVAQTETKTRNLLRERQARREQMQAALLDGLKGTNAELRDLASASKRKPPRPRTRKSSCANGG